MTRKLKSIAGGIHPPQHKLLSSETPISVLPFPNRLILPVSQHIGTPAHPIVGLGETVLANQVIAEADGGFSLPVHASTSGSVTNISSHPVPHASNLDALCITIEPDGEHRELEREGLLNFREQPKESLLAKIRDCGIAGMGGAGFPTELKLNPRGAVKIHTLIINGAECEPYITADDRLMRENAADIVTGAAILNYLLDDPENCLLAVEDNKPEAIAALRQAAQGTPVEIVELPTKYPSGGEKQLIEIICGEQLPLGKLPADLGILVQNITTTGAIYRAVTHGKPVFARVVTVSGGGVERPGNYKVLLGTPVDHLLKTIGYRPDDTARLVMGGPMMGFTISDTRVPIIKTSNCVLALTAEEAPAPKAANPCIRCGKCAQACPMQLLPQQLYWYARGHNHEQLQQHHLMDCIECGCCSYSCTSNIPLVHYFRSAKGELRAAEEERLLMERAKQRQQARTARQQALQAEREAKRNSRRKPSPAEHPAVPDTADQS